MAKHYEYNCETGETFEVELSTEEIQGAKIIDLEAQKLRELTIEAENKKALLLEKLGLTEDEAKLLLS